ncbi:hypothetical protein OG453_13365 [Streptomyces sp. NBC_01381]|uniref:hypothetical protein n=1 Tax=Streptomyces sp. NBC_01381 TaxID=2903845 RepID=UPI0022516735|nr:hypothetical protein [Streptomyces sp. NBC_01381]MCX4667641.1 hypothetical protein [Streptomyces sp. NBC_01381]
MATTRRPAKGGQLLLLAALLLGIVTMHTLGHPTGHGGGAERASAQASVQHEARGTTAAQGMGQAHDQGQSYGMGQAHDMGTEPVARTADDTVTASSPAGLHGMDPLSVCLAVLGAFTLVLLLKAGLLRPGGFAVPSRVLARLLDGLRPNPPPPRILLARLSVLRI